MRFVAAPTAYIVTPAELAVDLRIDHAEHEALLQQHIATATLNFERLCARAIMPQTWAFDAVAGDVESPMPDVIAATQGGVALVTDGLLISVPADGEVQITCGMPEYLRQSVKGAISLMAKYLYEGDSHRRPPEFYEMIISSMRWNQI